MKNLSICANSIERVQEVATVTKKFKFPDQNGFQDGIWIRYKIGLELFAMLRLSASAVDRKNAHNPKGLLKHFDIISDVHDMVVNQHKSGIELKVEIFGKDFLDECLQVALTINDKIGVDDFLGFSKDSFPKLSESKIKKLEKISKK